jgi:hypothetical protein
VTARRPAVAAAVMLVVVAACAGGPGGSPAAPSASLPPSAPATPRPTHPPEPTPPPRASLGNFDSGISELERLGLDCRASDDGSVVCSDADQIVVLLLNSSPVAPDQLVEVAGTVDLSRAGGGTGGDAFVTSLAFLEAIAEGSGSFVTDALREDRSLSRDEIFGRARLEVVVRSAERSLTFRLAGRELVD